MTNLSFIGYCVFVTVTARFRLVSRSQSFRRAIPVMNFVRAQQHDDTDDGQQADAAAGVSSAVVVLAARQAQRTGSPPRKSTILGIRKALQLKSGRPASPASPRQRRGSPVYVAFRPRGSPCYEAAGAQQQGRSSAAPAAATAATAAGASPPAGHRTSSRSPHRSRSRSRGRNRDNRHQQHSRRRSRSSSSSRSSREHSRLQRSRYRHRHGGSRSRSRSSRRRHRCGNSSRSCSRDRRRRSSRSRSRSPRRSGRRHSRSRSRSSSRLQQYTREERQQAWREARANPAAEPVRRGKQGLGFGGSSRVHAKGADAAGSPAAAGSRAPVQSLDAAAVIPGYSRMSAAEQLKARMRLAMQRSEQQLQRPAVGLAAAPAGQEGWTRFVFDTHGELEEDKAAAQALLDRELGQGGISFGSLVAPGEGGDATAAAAFVMGTGRAAKARAGAAKAAEAAHEDAIFGLPFGGAASAAVAAGSVRGGQDERPSAVQPDGLAEQGGSRSLADSLGVSEGLLAAVPEGPAAQQSWRERALALKARKQTI